MRKHTTDIIEDLKGTRCSWKMYLRTGMFFWYDESEFIKNEKQMIIYSNCVIIKQESKFVVFDDRI